MHVLTTWLKQTFSDPQVVFLALFLGIGLILILTVGDMLMPVLASAVIAYLLEGIVGLMERNGMPRLAAVVTVFIGFLLFVTLIIFGLIPALSRQVSQLVDQLPAIVTKGQQVLMQLPDRYPEIISTEHIQEVFRVIRQEITDFGQTVLTVSLSSVVGVITIMIYLVLMPLLVFFFLKDKQLICDWFTSFLPEDRNFAKQVWSDVDRQIANYVRGKFWEIIIVWLASLIAFSILGLQYAMLLAVLVGLSVIIPYIGAAVVTLPVLLIAWFQWGWGSEFIWLAVTYGVIQALDGNVLVPMLFSEVVDLHPVAIVVAILLFGGFWGFWGVFFAIPLATLVQAVLNAWPGVSHRIRENHT
ncbi:MAG: AI-2E family transporter [Chromatiales bacterium]|jgi:putative permease